MLLELALFTAMIQQQSAAELRVTHGKAQVGCETVPEFEQYHSVSYEKEGATPQTKGCFRLAPGVPVKALGNKAKAHMLTGDLIDVEQYEAAVGGKTCQLWLPNSALEMAAAK